MIPKSENWFSAKIARMIALKIAFLPHRPRAMMGASS
jgi:hypothetical protein